MPEGGIASIFAPELVRCIGEARDPDVADLFAVAGRVWAEMRLGRPAVAFGLLSPGHPDKVIALRMAYAALTGSTDPITTFGAPQV